MKKDKKFMGCLNVGSMLTANKTSKRSKGIIVLEFLAAEYGKIKYGTKSKNISWL